MITTAYQAAPILGIPHQRLGKYMREGKVSFQRAGGVHLVDTETAKRELAAAGSYRKLAVLGENLLARAAILNQDE